MQGLVVLAAVLAFVTGFDIADESVLNLNDGVKYRDCQDVLKSGLYKAPGAYNVYLNSSKPIQVYCRFEDGVGYTPIMMQKFGKQNFYRPYQDYVYGFGTGSSGDFWAGLNQMKYLTDSGNRVLTVTLQDWNRVIKVIRYNQFSLGSPSKQYPLSIGGYASSNVLPDDFSHNNGMPFSTYDRPDKNNCAINQRAGWWYNYCTYALPTGYYYQGGPYTPSGSFFDGIYYADWHGYGYSLLYIRMELSQN